MVDAMQDNDSGSGQHTVLMTAEHLL